MPELAKTYDPAGTEARWQQAWEDQGAFHPDPKAPGEPFSVVTVSYTHLTLPTICSV